LSSFNSKYDYTNYSNAISDGYEKGRGENTNGQIGTKTDIFGNSIGPGRLTLQSMNIYSNFFQYGANNPNALSDGDEKGRGENTSGQIGTKTDILGNLIGDPGRLGLLAINTYNNGFQYGVNNPNALSDGDEKGRGENASGQIGTKTDILGNSIGPGRNDLLLKNKYDLSKTYPDF
jgi:hypothetical protein